MEVQNTVVVFFAVTNRLLGDPGLRRDVLRTQGALAGLPPGLRKRKVVQLEACMQAEVLFVDGLRRTAPGPVVPNGLLGRDLWQRFAEASFKGVVDHALLARLKREGQPIDNCFARLTTFAGYDPTTERYTTQFRDGAQPDLADGLATSVIQPEALPVVVKWAPPWDILLPGAAALEALVEQEELRQVIALAASGRQREALAAAETQMGRRQMVVTLPSLGMYWQIAALHEGDDKIAIAAEDQFGLEVNGWKALRTHPRFLEHVRRSTVVPFLVGILGYAWWQCVQALREGSLPRTCTACRRLLPPTATARRQYCLRRESPGCYRARHAAVMRRRRQASRL